MQTGIGHSHESLYPASPSQNSAGHLSSGIEELISLWVVQRLIEDFLLKYESTIGKPDSAGESQ